jgi:hypothetical protein
VYIIVIIISKNRYILIFSIRKAKLRVFVVLLIFICAASTCYGQSSGLKSSALETSKEISGRSSSRVDSAVKSTKVPDLSLITSGEHVPNPLDLLNADKFGKLLDDIKTKFQRIIIDVPPVLSFSDCFFFGRIRAMLLFLSLKALLHRWGE